MKRPKREASKTAPFPRFPRHPVFGEETQNGVVYEDAAVNGCRVDVNDLAVYQDPSRFLWLKWNVEVAREVVQRSGRDHAKRS